MEGAGFADILQSFEKKAEGEEYVSVERDYNERRVIENDVRRTELLGMDKKNHKAAKFLKKLLFVELDKIPIRYTQGMSEVASVFVLYYLQEIVEEEIAKEIIGGESLESSEEDASENFIEVSEEENAELKRFVSRHKDVIAKVGVVLTNVFRKKLEPLVADDFKMYKENMGIFVEIMKKRGIKIPELESYKFMGSILTFFLRNLSKTEDVHRVFGIILSCPNTCPFILLVLFYGKIANNKLVENIDDDLFTKVVKLEEEFVEAKKRIGRKGPGFSKRKIVAIGSVISIVTAIVVYKITRRE
ncbi:hypothetical protein EHEL_100890 [Encephalitozoon hellem ATCC 50504]|uniref:GTPase-activating protein TBC1D15 n=1 Tax=Encephalitozoon hellem TaxID=27973 RepID=A0A9Q9FAE2_ENCHE|nr:uncharacterized protein EHEL_100890 [Encephalitozoon hellem ATCC 50504]AFM99182.1 hypothetical protein EHEL_100890 [Encephalitozoon hellem ATCC 50504]UTX44167.1 Rab-related GTPase [Encephalitozoon hellem]WEL39658.1 GTPase-activating protein TBC1D15 [Encephalitozoon hellem]|eukprot:XP_003888163.1 hypothetical protein EHEL_100890 [Encephalitozoon hellem ATCC 50504]